MASHDTEENFVYRWLEGRRAFRRYPDLKLYEMLAQYGVRPEFDKAAGGWSMVPVDTSSNAVDTNDSEDRRRKEYEHGT